MPRFKRLSRHGIVVLLDELQQETSPELTPDQRRCQAAQKISRPRTELFGTRNHSRADRFVRIEPKSQQLLSKIAGIFHHRGMARLQESAFVRFRHDELDATTV